jgi:replicative DNA helicase
MVSDPARGELFVNIGLNKSGKSFWLLNLAKYGLLQRLKVLYVTLELAEDKISQRLYQNLFVIPKRVSDTFVTKIDTDSLGRITGFTKKEFKSKTNLSDNNIEQFLKDKIDDWGPKFKNLIIKQFPDGSLTMSMLKAYLDGLENSHNFIPDLLIIDYADKMKLNVNNYRFEVSQTYVQLRGLGVERNMAVVTASQSNRAGKNAEVIDESNVAESWDKIAIADNVITYTQTKEEKKLKLARLFVSNARNDKDGLTVLISQNYDVGQFYVTSAMMTHEESYFGIMKSAANGP